VRTKFLPRSDRSDCVIYGIATAIPFYIVFHILLRGVIGQFVSYDAVVVYRLCGVMTLPGIGIIAYSFAEVIILAVVYAVLFLYFKPKMEFVVKSSGFSGTIFLISVPWSLYSYTMAISEIVK
jgi:hypothetical protein